MKRASKSKRPDEKVLEPVKQKRSKLPVDVLAESYRMTPAEARLATANYYASQDQRKRLDMQIRHFGEKDIIIQIPAFLNMSATMYADFETISKKVLENYASSSRVGRWSMAQVGVGPVITAGLLAHLDITRAPTCGHFWAFAGLDPSRKWERGQKRPYNAELKQLTYHLGECIKRTHNHPDSYYGPLYEAQKEKLVKANENGKNVERAKTFTTHSADVRKVLAKGMLPPNNIDRQACNWVAKMFLSHLHAVMYWDHYRKPPPRPFEIQFDGHAHEIAVPNTAEHFPGFHEAYYAGTPLIDAKPRRKRKALATV